MLPVKKATVEEMVSTYNSALKMIEDLNTLHQQAAQVFNQVCSCGEHIFMRLERFDTYELSKKELDRIMWRDIIRKTGILEVLTDKRSKEFDSEIESGKMPPVTVENVMNILNSLYSRTPDLLEEFCKSCYDMFIPSAYTKLKTNKDGEIKKRGILTGVWDCCWYSMHIHYDYGERKVKTLENAFSLLAGQGIVTDNRQNLVSQLNVAQEAGKKSFENDFFKFKWFHNSNLHVEFKRMDLVAKLNQIGAEFRLKSATPQGTKP